MDSFKEVQSEHAPDGASAPLSAADRGDALAYADAGDPNEEDEEADEEEDDSELEALKEQKTKVRLGKQEHAAARA